MISIKSFTHIDQPDKLAKKAFKITKIMMTNRGIKLKKKKKNRQKSKVVKKSENNAHQHTEDGGPIEIIHQKSKI